MNQAKPYLYCHSSSGYYYTRLTVPVDLRFHYRKTSLKQSLRTKDLQFASALSAQVIYQYKREFDILRAMERKPSKPPRMGLISLELPDGVKATIKQSDPQEEIKQAQQFLDAVKSTSSPTHQPSLSATSIPVADIIDKYCQEKNLSGAWTPQTD